MVSVTQDGAFLIQELLTACAGHGMNPDSKLFRWLKVTLFGCALGLFLVAANFVLWSFLIGANAPGRARFMAPFRLSAGPVEQELDRVIDSQLSDFRRGDYAGAYAFADSVLQAQVSPAVFERMVKSSYPAIARSRSASFGLSLDNGTEAVVTVGVMSEPGRLLQYRYYLRREHGGWKISGVVRVRAVGTTV
jgi:hypothetical protein